MNPPAEPGPPDEFSRKELERLDKVLAGGRWWFLVKRLARGLLPMSVIVSLSLGGLGPPSTRLLGIVSPAFGIGTVVAAIVVLFRIYPSYVWRAAAIRAGASYAPPQQLKDSYIFFMISLFLALACCSADAFWKTNDSTPIIRLFLFIAALVTCSGAIFKAARAYRACPATHLRRADCRSLLLGSILVLILYCLAALAVIALPAIIDAYLRSPRAKH